MKFVLGSRAQRGGVRLVALLGVAAAGLVLCAMALKHDGNEKVAGLVGVLAFFVAVWAFLAVWGARSLARSKRDKAARVAFPDEPWLWREDWAVRRVLGGTRSEAIVLTLFGLASMGLSAPGVWAIPRELRQHNYAMLLVLLFWVMGLAMLWGAWRKLRQSRRHGTMVFRPEPLPGSWGGFVGGVIHIPRGAMVGGEVQLALRCVRLRVSGRGKNRSTRETMLWETDAVLDRAKLGHEASLREVPVLFHVPRGRGAPSDERERDDRVVWRLGIDAPLVDGGRIAATFEIPVFDVGETVAEPTTGTPLLAQEKPRAAEEWLAMAGVTATREADAKVWQFYTPEARKAGRLQAAIAIVLIGITSLGIPFFSFFTGLFALLSLGIFLSTTWHRSECRLSGGTLEVRRFTWRGERRFAVKVAEVADLRLTKSMETAGLLYYRLNLVGLPGVDAETPHPHEHFAARKARFRWKKQPGDAARERALRETPRFEIEVAGYLKGTKAAERVREHLLAAIIDA